jgi:hypothetical protein
VRNALVVLHPSPSFSERFFVVERERLVVEGSICNCAGNRIDHGFKQTSYGRHLVWSKTVDQFLKLVLFLSYVDRHGGSMTLFILPPSSTQSLPWRAHSCVPCRHRVCTCGAATPGGEPAFKPASILQMKRDYEVAQTLVCVPPRAAPKGSGHRSIFHKPTTNHIRKRAVPRAVTIWLRSGAN